MALKKLIDDLCLTKDGLVKLKEKVMYLRRAVIRKYCLQSICSDMEQLNDKHEKL